MASRSKRRLDWNRLLWLGVFLSFVSGLWFSPLTSARKVRVVGALPDDHARIIEIVQAFRRAPAIRAPRDLIMAKLLRRPLVINASVSQHLFARALVEITYDQPVATMEANRNIILTKSGEFSSIKPLPRDLPKLRLFDSAFEPNVALARNWQTPKIAEVCERIARSELGQVTVSVAASGAVSLELASGPIVYLGAPEFLPAKFEQLTLIGQRTPEHLKGNKEINLMSADKPTIAERQKP
ncbi:MAG: hypothetical protein ABL962_01120 [Fimbriimonadaceae bacterium]